MAHRPRIGAYVMAADPTWIRSSLSRYYDHLDQLLISASRSNRGWSGSPIQADECVSILKSIDHRGIARVSYGEWINRNDPIAADTAQRRAAVAEIGTDVDWIIQIDTDEVLPDFGALLRVIKYAEEHGIDAIEWPMRVLFRRLRDGRYLEVVSATSEARYEYPGPIAVRSNASLEEARRTAGAFVRPVVQDDTQSTQIARPSEPRELRAVIVSSSEAIIHNSWARPPRAVREKIAAWGHNQGWRSQFYYYSQWWPAPLHWRYLRNFHPLYRELWPRLAVLDQDLTALLDPADRENQTNRFA